MRRCFACHVHAAALGRADDLDAFLGRNVADVVGAARFLGKLHVACDLPPLALRADTAVPVGAGIRAVVDVTTAKQGVVLAVRGKDLAEMSALGHRLAHHALGLHAAPVVGKGDDVWCHARKVCKPLALFADRDRPIGMDMNEGVLLDERALERERFGAVGHGVQVRHGGNVSEAAVRGGQCAGTDGFLIRKSRLTKMNMNINETGKQNHIRNINNNSIIGRGNTITNRNDLSVRKKHVRQMKHALREKLCILQKIAHFHFLLVLFSVHYTG